MGRELQKKKNRSSVSKVPHKPKSKKVDIKGNPIIAANWNNKETFAQNYRRLGLTARLNAPTGGTEKRISDAATNTTSSNSSSAKPAADSLAITHSANSKALIPTEARIERDASGNIVRVIHANSSSKCPNPLNDPLNDLSDSEEGQGERDVVRSGAGLTAAQTDVVSQLEEEAAFAAPPKRRKQSQREEEWVQSLVERHGDDYRAMFWDRKLNPMQQSQADLRRRVEKWEKGRKSGEAG